jgi:hypothetical protein
MKVYKIWFIDTVEPEGGYWWYCFEDDKGYLRQVGYDYTSKLDIEELDTLQWYIDNGYEIVLL